MAQADGSVVIDIEGNAEKFKSALNSLGGVASSALKGVTTAIGMVSGAIGGIATAAIKVGSDFESSMSQVAATMGLTVEDINNGSAEFELLSQAAKDAGATTAFSASEAAEALNYLALAGYDAQTAADALPAVLNLAAAGGLDLAYASDLATDAMSALGIEASNENLTKFGDQMAKTASKANTSVGQLGEAILTVGGTAKGLAGGTTELNAALGVLANRGIKGAEGGTALRNIILALSAPTKKAAEAMEALGVDAYDATGNLRPLNEVFGDLDSAMSGMSEGEKTQILNEIFNKVDLKSAQALLAGCGAEFDNLATAIENSGGAMQDMADTQLNNLQGDLTILKSGLEGLGIALYDGMQKPLRAVVQEATAMVGQLSSALSEGGLSGMVQEVGTVFSDILFQVAAQIPKFIDMGVQTIQSFLQGITQNKEFLSMAIIDIVSSLVSGILSVSGDIMSAGAELILALGEAFVRQAPDLLQKGAEAVGNLVQGIIDGAPDFLAQAAELISGFADSLSKSLPELVPKAVEMIGKLVESITSNLDQVIAAGLEVILALGEGLIAAIPSLIETIPDIVINIADVINNNAPKLIETGLKLIAQLAVGLIQAIPTLVANIPKIIEAIVKAWSAFNWINLGKSAIEFMKNGITGMLGTLKSVGKSVLEAITNAIKNLPQNLAEIGRNGINGLVSTIQGLGSSAVSAMQSLASNLFTAVQDLPSKMLEIGKGIIDGIIKGIQSGIAAAINAVVNLAKTLVDKAKGALGIKSPSRVFAKEVGAFVPPGIGEGINKAMPQLDADMKKQLQGLVDDANLSVAAEVGSVSSKLAVSAGTGGSYGGAPQAVTNDNGITINLTYNGSSEPEDIRKISRQLGIEAQKEMRRRGVFA